MALKVLLDECVPYGITNFLMSRGFQVFHVQRSDLSGRSNGEIYDAARTDFDLFITSDRHFKTQTKLRATEGLGVLYVRVRPLVEEGVREALEYLLANLPPNELVGKRVVARRGDFEIIP